MHERRRGKRIPIKIWAINNAQNEFSVWFPTDPPTEDFRFAYSTKDLSVYGVFLISNYPLSVGTILELELRLPDIDPVRIKGKVVRVVDPEEATEEAPAGMGVEFLPASDYEREIIKKFVDLYGKSGTKPV